MLGVFEAGTAAFEINGESVKVLTPEVDIYLKGNCYLPRSGYLDVLGEIAIGASSDEQIRGLPGQFVIVIHDKRTRKVALVRDHIGQQPLYYTVEDDRLLFASSIGALRTLAKRPWSLGMRGFHDYFAVKYAVPPATLFDEVSEQTPGTIVEFSSGRLQPERVFFNKIPCAPLVDRGSNESSLARFKLEFDKSFGAACADADSQKFGILSSGGIDSSVLVSAYRRLIREPVPTYYVGCEGYKNDKANEAEAISRLFGTRHRNVHVSAVEFANHLLSTIEIVDFPLNSPSTVLRNCLYSGIAGEVDVLLSGEGADSLYTGYYIFDLVYRFHMRVTVRQSLAALVRLMPLSMIPGDGGRKARLIRRAIITPPAEYLLHSDTFISNNAEQLASMLESYDSSWYLPTYKRELSGQGGVDILDRILGIYQSSFLSENLAPLVKLGDKYGLQHRHPFIHCPMVDAFNAISWDRKAGKFTRKRLVVEMAKEYLPPPFYRAPKEGFGVPIAEWFRDPSGLGQFVDLLNSRSFRERGLFKKAYVDTLLSEYQRDQIHERWYEQVLWPMVNFELWSRRYLDKH